MTQKCIQGFKKACWNSQDPLWVFLLNLAYQSCLQHLVGHVCEDQAFYHRVVLSQGWLICLVLCFSRSRKDALGLDLLLLISVTMVDNLVV